MRREPEGERGRHAQAGRGRKVFLPRAHSAFRLFRERRASALLELMVERQRARFADLDPAESGGALAELYRSVVRGNPQEAFVLARRMKDGDIFGCTSPSGERLIVFPDDFSLDLINSVANSLGVRFSTYSDFVEQVSAKTSRLLDWELHLRVARGRR